MMVNSMYSPTSPVTGAPQTGFTSPTYTITADNAPDTYTKQFFVSAIGGTQTGVSIHTAALPFYTNFRRPKQFKNLPSPNPVTGLYASIPRNTSKRFTRKGGYLTATLYVSDAIVITQEFTLRAGAETGCPAEVRGAISLDAGVYWQQAAGIGDSLITGVI